MNAPHRTLVQHASHWGAFSARVREGRIEGVEPFVGDPDPSPLILGTGDAVHAACRIDRSYVRKGWLDGDRAGGTLRGAEPFVPVDWDTATALVASELRRVRDDHGPASIFGGSYGWSSAGRFHHARGQLHRLLAAAGGFTSQLNSYSYAAAQVLLPHVVGSASHAVGQLADWPSIAANAKLMLCFGGVLTRNGQVCAGGTGAHEMHAQARAAARAGVRLVGIAPMRGDMPDDLGAEWLPIRPGTDTAMLLAMAHALIAEDRIDHAFLDRCTVGFDRFRAYVLGESDGRPKTPGWAASLTGLPAATIVALARDCASQPTMLTAAWSLQRAEFGEQPYWAMIALAAMLGGIGRPGTGFGFGHGSIGGAGSPHLDVPSLNMPALPNPERSFIPVARLTDMLENPGGDYEFNGRRLTYPDTRLIYWVGGNPFHHHQDLNRLLRAWARAETIVVHEPWWTSAARHADIVLPATTTLERDDIGAGGRDRFVLAMRQAVPPQGQARHDFDILADIARHLGVHDRFTGQRGAATWMRVLYDSFRAECARRGVALPDYEGFWEQGHVELPDPGRPYVPFADFVADPVAHPLDTPSGRIELFSDTIAGFGYDDCPGHPAWLEPSEYLGSPLAARFPLHLLSHQPATRLHGQMDQARVSLTSKIEGREPVLMHAADAAARGLAEGDIVRVFNDRGACLAGVRIGGADLVRGVVALATGAWFDPERPGAPGSLCVHGNPNVLTRDVGTSRLSQAPVAMSCLVEIERWEGALPAISVHGAPSRMA